MDASTAVEHLHRIAAVRGDGAAGRAEIEDALRSVGRMQSWLVAPG